MNRNIKMPSVFIILIVPFSYCIIAPNPFMFNT